MEVRNLLTTLVVNTASDVVDANDDLISLREAIATTNTNDSAQIDTIRFARSLTSGAPATITLSGTQLNITEAVTITGPGADLLEIDADDQSRIFNVDDNDDNSQSVVAIEGLTLTGANVTGGGTIYNKEDLTVTNSTITGNTTYFGGGIANCGTVTVTNTIVAGNSQTSRIASDMISSGTVTGKFNLIGSGGSGGLTNNDQGNQVGVDWKTVLVNDGTNFTLADNGGPTQTIALLAGSPAINARSNTLVPADVEFDQRGAGFARIVGGTVDIGAYENENIAPVADDITVTGDEDTDITGKLTATNTESNPLTFTKASDPTSGSVTVNVDGSFTYRPVANFNGSDSFMYTVPDGSLSDTGTVTIMVASVNDQPVAGAVAASAIENGPAVTGNFSVTDVDKNDTHTFSITAKPLASTVTNNDDGTFTFDPGADFQDLEKDETRDVTFTYTATDNSGAANATSGEATVTVTVTGTNDAPTHVQVAVVRGDLIITGDAGSNVITVQARAGFVSVEGGASTVVTYAADFNDGADFEGDALISLGSGDA